MMSAIAEHGRHVATVATVAEDGIHVKAVVA
jgi:hypothetical protein